LRLDQRRQFHPQGTTRFISSGNKRFRVFFVDRANPGSACFMAHSLTAQPPSRKLQID
jgi:hypothetical protein